jgi:heme/copper-type cytochrome/quinol oxidase subunit 2
MLRLLLLALVFTQFVLLVALAVLVSGYALAAAVEDTTAATVLWWGTMGCLMLIAMDILLLVGVLGIWSLVDLQQRGAQDHQRRERP